MVLQQNTRVRKLHLTGNDDTKVRRAAILLEDAFHIASLPTVALRRLVIVRSLHLKNINTDHSATGIALKIAHNLSKLQSTAIHAEAANAADHPIVYFQDEIEPYRCLAARLAGNEDTSAWFWPLAVPCWNPNLSPHTALRTILFHIIQTEARTHAALTLLCFLHDQNRLDSLLEVLNSKDGQNLLQGCGWSVPSNFFELTIRPLTPSPTSQEQIGPKLRSLQWQTTLQRWIRHWGEADSRTTWLATMMLLEKNPTYLLDSKVVGQAQGLIKWVAAQSCPDSFNPSITSNQFRPPSLKDSQTGPHDTPLTWADKSHLTEYAGLFFLLPILSRLGMAEWLKTSPQYVEMNFPHLVLRYVALSLGIPSSNPILSPFIISADEERESVCEYIAPCSWQQGLCSTNSLVLRKMDGQAGIHILCDESGRFPLALWQGPIPTVAQEVIGNKLLQEGLPMRNTTPLSVALKSWHMAMRRWCRRYAYLGLYNLVSRSGRIVNTPTHIDLIFDLCKIDIRLRKSGLDINPGWVPWFGRVVQFHYEERENKNVE